MRALHAARGRIAPLCSRGRFVSTAGALAAKRQWVRLGQLDREQERVGQLARTDNGRSRNPVARAEQILRTRGGVWPLRVERRGSAVARAHLGLLFEELRQRVGRRRVAGRRVGKWPAV